MKTFNLIANKREFLSPIGSIILFLMILSAPAFSQTTNKNEVEIIDFESIVGKEIGCKLSEIVNKIEYIVLETRQECLVGEIRSWCMSRDHILIVSDNKVLKFDRSGKFIRAIGSRGQGPGEYVKPINVTTSPSGDIYILDTGIRRILIFSPQGEFKEKISLPRQGHPWQLYYFDNSLLLVNQLLPPLQPQLNRINLDSHTIQPFKVFSGLLNSTLQNGALDYVSIDNNGSTFFYTSAWNDTVFSIADQQLKIEYLINIGKFKYPLKGKVGSLANESLVKGKVYQYWKAIKTNYLFFQYDYKLSQCLAAYDTRAKKFIFNGTKDNSIINDIDGGFGIHNIYNSNSDIGNYMANIYPAFNFKTMELEEVYATKKDRENLTNLLKSIDESDNPIIQLMHLK